MLWHVPEKKKGSGGAGTRARPSKQGKEKGRGWEKRETAWQQTDKSERDGVEEEEE